MIGVRVIKPSTVRRFAEQYPDASKPLMTWLKEVRKARWSSLQQVRETYSSADAATVNSGHIVTVFNIGGNKYRLIVAIHYQRGMVFVLRFLTHAEYDKEKWKADL